MGHLFQDECWEKHHSGFSLRFIMAKEISKGNGKGFRKEKWHLLEFVYENDGK